MRRLAPHPLLVALLEHLPTEGRTMSEPEIEKFLKAFEAAVRLIYTNDAPARGEES